MGAAGLDIGSKLASKLVAGASSMQVAGEGKIGAGRLKDRRSGAPYHPSSPLTKAASIDTGTMVGGPGDENLVQHVPFHSMQVNASQKKTKTNTTNINTHTHSFSCWHPFWSLYTT
jgi:hypothetical protein